MRREQVKRMLESYRQCKARRESLALEIDLAERQLSEARERMTEDAVLPGHDLARAPGGGAGDPTARLAVKFASGYQPRYILEMAGDIRRMRDEMRECETVCRCVEAWRGVLNERELLVIDRHVIGGESYADVLEDYARRFPATALTSLDGVKCVNKRAIGKIFAAAGA
ncbi:MAG: hypothetical protein IJ157_06960 [Clostridia bacterium]|nr:hypothetical protein [Clostridia bacterium]